MDPLTLIAAASAGIKLVETIRGMIRSGKVSNANGTPYTIEQFEADLAKGHAVLQEGAAMAQREIGG